VPCFPSSGKPNGQSRIPEWKCAAKVATFDLVRDGDILAGGLGRVDQASGEIPLPTRRPDTRPHFSNTQFCKSFSLGCNFGVHGHKKKGSPTHSDDGLKVPSPKVVARELSES
jgi:hypothetical protein